MEFEEFVRAHRAGLVRLAYGACGALPAAEDAVQDALFAVYRRWRHVQADPLPYARRAVLNATVSGWRRQRRWPLASHAQEGERRDARSQEAFEEVESQSVLRAAVGGLPVGQRKALLLRFGIGLSVEETAQVLQISPGTVKSQTHKGLQALRAARPVVATKESAHDE